MTRTSTILTGIALAAIVLAACAQRPAQSPAPRGSQAAPAAPPPSAISPQAGPSTVVVPQGRPQWVKPDATNAQYRADLESCFDFAQARIAHDERIETDTRAAFDSAPSGFGVSELSGRMSAFERKNRRSSLYRDCMRDKGYVEQQ